MAYMLLLLKLLLVFIVGIYFGTYMAEYYVWQQALADGEIACFHVRVSRTETVL